LFAYGFTMRIATGSLSIAVGVCLAGCGASPMLDRHGTRPATLTPTELIATAEARRGQRLTLTGYFTWRTDTRALWESRDAHLDAEQERNGPEFDYWSKCVTIYPASPRAKRLSGRQVRVTGRVAIIAEPDPRSLWACNRVALEEAVVTSE
jgi:hypothetical protein